MSNSKKRSIALIASAAVVLGIGGVLAVTRPWEKPPPVRADSIGASLELAAGDVRLYEGDAERRLLSGTPLPVGAIVGTGAGARALVRLADGSRVFLRDDTKIRIDGGVTLEQGQMWLDAPPLEAEQDAVVHHIASGGLGVSLSDGGASLALEGDTASVYVAEGLAIVTAPGGRAEVGAGQQASVTGDAPPSVEPVAFWDDWTGGMGDRRGARSGGVGAGVLYAVDRSAGPGAEALPLAIQRQSVRVAVEDDVAETLVDQHFFNPSGTVVEGWYWFTIPPGSQIVSFALETNGVLVEAEVVERNKASKTYEAAVQRAQDPALLEWIDERTVRARIFPVPALGTRRIVLRYQQLLTESEGKIRYRYPLSGAAGREAAAIEDFSLQVQLRGGLEKRYDLATLSEAVVSKEGSAVTMRRSGYTPRADFELELTRKTEHEREPLRLNMLDPGGDKARFVMVRYSPEVDFTTGEPPRGEIVVVVDTSAAGDPAEYQTRLAVAEALLRSLSAGDRFAIMSADVTADVLYPEGDGLADATPEAIADAMAKVAGHSTGGATDLGAIFEGALARVHGLEQPAVVYIGDGLVTSGERDGDALAERLRRSIAGSSARLFALGVGADVDEALLGRLARVGGGHALRVTSPELAVVRALELSGALKTPTITDLELDVGVGLDDVFVNVAGKLSRGQEMVLLARTHHDLPETVTIHGRMGGEEFEAKHDLVRDQGLLDRLVPRLWAKAYVERLLGDSRGPEAVRGKVLSLGLEYGMMTPFTSLLALDSEQAYARQGIQRRHRRFASPRLTADAAWMRGAERETVTPLTAAAAFFSAPFGCGASRGGDDEPPPVSSARADVSENRGPAQDAKPVDGVVEKANLAPGRHEAEVEEAPSPVEDRPTNSPTTPELAADEAPAPPAKPRPTKRPAGGVKTGKKGKMDESGIRLTEAGAEAPIVTAEVTKTEAHARSGEESRAKGEFRRRPPRERKPSPIARRLQLPCSDAAARGLSHRRVLWNRRLEGQPNMYGALNAYEAAAGSCEIKGWKDQRVFLQLLHKRAHTEDEIGLLLSHFHDEPEARNYLARGLFRRLVDPTLVAAVEAAMFPGGVDWTDVDRQLLLMVEAKDGAEPEGPDLAERQLALVQKALARSPGDPQGERRMLQLLIRHGRLEQAVSRGQRLREQGLLTPFIVQQLGEALVAHGDPDRARRAFSELVEFDPHDANSRRLLGDIFLRHRWYDAAYRQFEDLTALVPEDALAVIRLALAAAGTGRIDEARRILRKVAAGEGRPGVNDPRRHARLHAAVLLARLLQSDDADVPKASIGRELGRLQLFDGAAGWTVITWRDLGARLVFGSGAGETTPGGVEGDVVDAGETGLRAVQSATLPALADVVIRHAGVVPDRVVDYEVLTIRRDGSGFAVQRRQGTIPAGEATDAKPKPAPSG